MHPCPTRFRTSLYLSMFGYKSENRKQRYKISDSAQASTNSLFKGGNGHES